eukprot:m.180926 g.180926  ORF g.180926 m.180926 type:complete len:52 (+) comp14660_c2_seq2:209-364(+)
MIVISVQAHTQHHHNNTPQQLTSTRGSASVLGEACLNITQQHDIHSTTKPH